MAFKQFGWAASARHSQAYAGLFLLCLAFGLAAGIPIGRVLLSTNRQPRSQVQDQPEYPLRPTNGQNNWLVLGVDDLQAASPRLESAWLALFFPGKPQVIMLPVFPVPGTESLGERFSLDLSGAPAAGFKEALHSERLWWSGYVILDAAGLASILDFLASNIPPASRDPVFADLTRRGQMNQDGFTIQQNQTRLIEAACQQATGFIAATEVKELAAGLTPHLRTDLDLAQVALAWPVTEEGKIKVDCEFPLLAVSN